LPDGNKIITMKDTVITAKRKKTEIIFLLASFILAFILNIYAISTYDTLWSEIFTTFHITLLLTLVIYFLILIVRLIILGVMTISQKFSRS